MNESTPLPTVWQRSTTRRTLQWLCSWRGVGTMAVAIASLVTLVALFYAVENRTGQRAWNRCRQELEAQGEKLDFHVFLPPPVPDEQNVAAAPIFAHVFEKTPPGVPEDDRPVHPDARLRRVSVNLQADPARKAPRFPPLDSGSLIDLAPWQRFFAGNTNYPQPAAPQSAAQDVLLALSGFEAELSELEQAATRPKCRWPVDYTVSNPIAVRLPHLARLRGLAQVPLLRAAAQLEMGQPAKALADLTLILRLADSLEGEPFLISFLVRRRLVADAVTGVREGLVRHAWTDAQLAEIERRLAGVDLLVAHQAAMRGERAMSLACVDYVRRSSRADKLREFFDTQGDLGEAILARGMPSGWYYQNQATIARLYQQHILPGVNPSTRRVFPKTLAGAEAELRTGAEGLLARLRAIRSSYFADLLLPAAAPGTAAACSTPWAGTPRTMAASPCVPSAGPSPRTRRMEIGCGPARPGTEAAPPIRSAGVSAATNAGTRPSGLRRGPGGDRLGALVKESVQNGEGIGTCPGGAVCPLSRVNAGAAVRIKRLAAPPEVCQRLRELGLCEEQQIKLLQSGCNLICLVCNARLALSSQVGESIFVEPIPRAKTTA